MGKVILQIKTINTVISENMLHKNRITIRISHGKIQIFQKFSLRMFLKFPTDSRKI